jgi:hypothetical protein
MSVSSFEIGTGIQETTSFQLNIVCFGLQDTDCTDTLLESLFFMMFFIKLYVD